MSNSNRSKILIRAVIVLPLIYVAAFVGKVAAQKSLPILFLFTFILLIPNTLTLTELILGKTYNQIFLTWKNLNPIQAIMRYLGLLILHFLIFTIVGVFLIMPSLN